MNAIKISPALYQFEGVNWTWVKLEELAEIVGITPKECWEKYFSLTKGLFQWRVFLYAFWPSAKQSPEQWGPYISAEDASTVYVPAGWATDVLKEVAKEKK